MDSLAITNKKVSNSKNLLIVKMDAIGDYILFRNFLKAIKEDKKYSKYKITLCGNSVWKDISEKFDSKVIDEFYWINKKKFLIKVSYFKKIINIIFVKINFIKNIINNFTNIKNIIQGTMMMTC